MSVDLVWPGGEHSFALRIGELEALQQATGEGPGASLNRLYTSMASDRPMLGAWKIADVVDTIRLGLIGGGMAQIEARNAVKAAIDRHGIVALIPAAAEILMTALRAGDGNAGKPKGPPQPEKNGTSDA